MDDSNPSETEVEFTEASIAENQELVWPGTPADDFRKGIDQGPMELILGKDLYQYKDSKLHKVLDINDKFGCSDIVWDHQRYWVFCAKPAWFPERIQYAYISKDGVNWQLRELPALLAQNDYVRYSVTSAGLGGSLCYEDSLVVWRYTDAEEWQISKLNERCQWTSASWDDTTFIVTHDRVYASGISSQKLYALEFDKYEFQRKILLGYSDTIGAPVKIVRGPDGYVMQSRFQLLYDEEYRVFFSKDMRNWNRVDLDTNCLWQDVIWDGLRYMAVGNCSEPNFSTSVTAFSNDGVSWEMKVATPWPYGYTFQQIGKLYFKSLHCLVSVDGIEWHPLAPGYVEWAQDAYARRGGGYMFLGDNGQLGLLSDDGSSFQMLLSNPWRQGRIFKFHDKIAAYYEDEGLDSVIGVASADGVHWDTIQGINNMMPRELYDGFHLECSQYACITDSFYTTDLKTWKLRTDLKKEESCTDVGTDTLLYTYCRESFGSDQQYRVRISKDGFNWTEKGVSTSIHSIYGIHSIPYGFASYSEVSNDGIHWFSPYDSSASIFSNVAGLLDSVYIGHSYSNDNESVILCTKDFLSIEKCQDGLSIYFANANRIEQMDESLYAVDGFTPNSKQGMNIFDLQEQKFQAIDISSNERFSFVRRGDSLWIPTQDGILRIVR